MGIIVVLIAISVTIALTFLGVFYWSIKSGQYDDTYTPSVRMLFDDKPSKDNPSHEETQQPHSPCASSHTAANRIEKDTK